MPDARNENVCCLRNNSIANDIAGRAEADHDLADVSIFGLHAQRRKFLQSLDRGPYQRQCAPCGAGISLIEKGSQSLDILHGVGRKEGSSDLARLRTRQFVRGPPACDPCLDIIKRNSEPGPSEFVVAAAILGDVGPSEVDNRIEQRDGFSQYGGNVLAAFRRHLAKAGICIGINLKRTANHVHG